MSLISDLQAIRDEHGTLTPALVVDLARDPDHPLHSRFEWDDSVAAEKWRLEQAGQLLRVTFRPDPKKPVDLRAFVVHRGENTPTSDYIPTEEAFSDPLIAAMVLRAMEREAKAFAARYRHHKSYAATVQRLLLGDVS